MVSSCCIIFFPLIPCIIVKASPICSRCWSMIISSWILALWYHILRILMIIPSSSLIMSILIFLSSLKYFLIMRVSIWFHIWQPYFTLHMHFNCLLFRDNDILDHICLVFDYSSLGDNTIMFDMYIFIDIWICQDRNNNLTRMKILLHFDRGDIPLSEIYKMWEL